MPKPLIFDSTPLIYLIKSSLTTYFEELTEEKFTTTSVFNEIVQEGKKKRAPEATLLETLFKQQAIKIQNPTDHEHVKYVKEVAAESEMQPLHEAEAEVLSLAKEINGVAIADDQVARLVARLLGIELHGTAYVLGRIFATGKIDKETLIKKVKEMREDGWYVSAEDYLKIIDYLKDL
jgi:predicted nucleic acid-binding protein